MDGRLSPTVSSGETSAATSTGSAAECFGNAPLNSVSSRCCGCCCRGDIGSVVTSRRIGHLAAYVLLTLLCAAATCWNFRAIAARLSSKSCGSTRVVCHSDGLATPRSWNNPIVTRLSSEGAVRSFEGCAYVDAAAALQLAIRLSAELNVTDLLRGRLSAIKRTSPQAEASTNAAILEDNYAVVHVGKSWFEKGLRGETFNWSVIEKSSSPSHWFAYSGGHVKVRMSGHYFVYAQVGFLMVLNSKQQPPKTMSYDLMITRKGVKITLARGGGSFCWISDAKDPFALQSSYVGRVAYLQQNDDLYVLMGDPNYAWHDPHRTFFGAYFLSDSSRYMEFS